MTQLDTIDPAKASDSHLITAEELFDMGDIGRCELLYGEPLLPGFTLPLVKVFRLP